MDYTIQIDDPAEGLALITLAQAKKQLRIEHDYEDEEILGFIESAVAEAESYLGAKLLSRTAVFGFPYWQKNTTFPMGPVSAVTEVSYLEKGHAERRVLDNTADADYKLYNYGDNKDVLLIKAEYSSLSLEQDTPDAVLMTVTVGYETPAKVPKDIKSAIKLILTDLYEYRGDREIKMNRSSRNLLRPYKRWA
jgi:uncharacterized phiE125 gp8 family phage protein